MILGQLAQRIQGGIFFQHSAEIPDLNVAKFPAQDQILLIFIESQSLHWGFGLLIDNTLGLVSNLEEFLFLSSGLLGREEQDAPSGITGHNTLERAKEEEFFDLVVMRVDKVLPIGGQVGEDNGAIVGTRD